MNILHNAIKPFWNDEDGLEMVEYAVIAGVLAIVLGVAFGGLATSVQGTLTNVVAAL